MGNEQLRIWGATALAATLLAIGSIALAQRQWRHDLAQTRLMGETSVAQLAPLLEGALRSSRYAEVPEILARWGRADPTIASIAVTARNGFDLGRFRRAEDGADRLDFRASLSYGYAGEAQIDLAVDTTGPRARRRQLAAQLAFGNLALDLLMVGAARLLIGNRRSVRRYRVLYAVNEALIDAPDDRHAFLGRIVEAAVAEGGFALAWIGFLDEHGVLRPAAVAGPAAGYAENLSLSIASQDPGGQGPAGRALRENRTVIVDDFQSNPQTEPWAARARAYGIRSSVALPLKADGATIGLLGLYGAERDHFDADEQAMVEQMAGDLSFGLEHRRRGERIHVELERNRLFLENAVDLVHILDRGGRLVAASRSFCDFLGYGLEELQGRGPDAWNEYADEERIAQDMGRALDGEVLRFDSVYRRKDGGQVDVEVLLSAFTVSGVAYLYVSARSLAEIKRLERELLDVANREQRRLGQEMHDGLGQELTGTALIAEALAARSHALGLPDAEDLRALAADVRRCILTARAIVRGLSPLVEVGGNLAVGLIELANGKRSVAGVEIRVDADPHADTGLSAESNSHLFRIAQEALQNALKYARATHVDISLQHAAGEVVLAVADDGVGLPDDAGERGGYGMGTMRYRARALRGRLAIEPRPGGGTVVTCRVPRGV